MSEIIQFPVPDEQKTDRDSVIEEELKSIPKKDREKIRFELIKMIDSYDDFFTEWNFDLPEDCSATLRKQVYDTARQEYDRKMLMLKDIMRLKTKVLVAEYHNRN